jgi:hypothetical protein
MQQEKIFSMHVAVRTSPNSVHLEDRDLEAEDLGNYIVLREMLSRFERRMVEYFFAGETAAVRSARAEEIRLAIREIPDPIWAVAGKPCSSDADCGPREQCIGGVCQSADVDEPAPEAPASVAQQTAG